MTQSIPISDSELAVAAALHGMNQVRDHRGDVGIYVKKDGRDLATSVDLAVEIAIREVLSATRPDDGIVGEEFGGLRLGGDRTWFVDPLCGTRNFAWDTPPYCINVALKADGSTCVAAVADPISQRITWTDGTAVYERVGTGSDRTAVPVSDSRIVELNADGPAALIGPLLVADEEFRTWMTPRVSASTLALAWVASGRRAAYVSDGDLLDSVHFVAGIALCISAGCVVTDLVGGPTSTGNGLAIAADLATHTALLKHIARCL